MSEFKPLELDTGIYEDPWGDEDMGFFRGPRVIRKPGETYEQFRDRIKVEAQKLVDEYNSIPELRKVITSLQNRVTELETEMENRMSCPEDGHPWLKD